MWSNSLTPEVAEASSVVSDSGESLSPTSAPEMIAPAAISTGTPRPCAIPISAMPIVPAVPQEVPVTMEVMMQMMKAIGRKIFGLMRFTP